MRNSPKIILFVIMGIVLFWCGISLADIVIKSSARRGVLAGPGKISGKEKEWIRRQRRIIKKVEIVRVIPIRGNNPFNQRDPINNVYRNGRVIWQAADQTGTTQVQSQTQIQGQSQAQQGPSPAPVPVPAASPLPLSIMSIDPAPGPCPGPPCFRTWEACISRALLSAYVHQGPCAAGDEHMFTIETSYTAANGKYLFQGAPKFLASDNWALVSWIGTQANPGYYSSYNIVIKDKTTGQSYNVRMKIDSANGQISQN